MENQTYQNKEQDKRIKDLESRNKELRVIVFNHITENTKEIGDVKTNIAIVKTDTAWLKKTYWVVATASISAAVIGLINLLAK